MRGFAPKTYVAARTVSGQTPQADRCLKPERRSPRAGAKRTPIMHPNSAAVRPVRSLHAERVEPKAGREPAAAGEKSVAVDHSSSEFDPTSGSSRVAARAPAQTRCPRTRIAKPARRSGDAAQVFARLAATPIRPTDQSDLAVRVSPVCADRSGVATSMPLLWTLTRALRSSRSASCRSSLRRRPRTSRANARISGSARRA